MRRSKLLKHRQLGQMPKRYAVVQILAQYIKREVDYSDVFRVTRLARAQEILNKLLREYF